MIDSTNITATIWMTLARIGGYSNAREIKKANPELDNHDLGPYLAEMVHSERVRREQVGKEHPKFGVTVGCKVPQGVTIGEIIRVLIRPGEPPTTT